MSSRFETLINVPADSADGTERARNAALYPGRRVAGYALALLMITAIISLLDRQILTLLIQPIKTNLNISDTQMSLLQDFTFTLFYTFMDIPLGLMVDRVNRRNLIVFGVMVWSVMTILCGLPRDSGPYSWRVSASASVKPCCIRRRIR